ncbi:Uu.00g146600.m01.CDS01 [Anthostomella pinea]|uniref:Uu.00g146600.m01.CDS01 n=1 Tax=Anthostomella pinea TaxID=933095 RepID=A0AAI8YM04_9PEZI|nr:Uu.00g146600.m01.CDS01 [Anthostomella pinea]
MGSPGLASQASPPVSNPEHAIATQSTNPDQEVSPEYGATFTFFPRLPIELRRMIWELAVASVDTPPAVVELYLEDNVARKASYCTRAELVYAPTALNVSHSNSEARDVIRTIEKKQNWTEATLPNGHGIPWGLHEKVLVLHYHEIMKEDLGQDVGWLIVEFLGNWPPAMGLIYDMQHVVVSMKAAYEAAVSADEQYRYSDIEITLVTFWGQMSNATRGEFRYEMLIDDYDTKEGLPTKFLETVTPVTPGVSEAQRDMMTITLRLFAEWDDAMKTREADGDPVDLKPPLPGERGFVTWAPASAEASPSGPSPARDNSQFLTIRLIPGAI